MSQDRIYVGGELYLSIERVADIYSVEVVWLREVVESGLLRGAFVTQPAVCISAVRLDHVATIVRLHHVLGLDVEAIRLALEDSDPPR